MDQNWVFDFWFNHMYQIFDTHLDTQHVFDAISDTHPPPTLAANIVKFLQWQ